MKNNNKRSCIRRKGKYAVLCGGEVIELVAEEALSPRTFKCLKCGEMKIPK